MLLPESTEKLGKWSLEIIDRCRASAGSRARQAKELATLIYTGSADGDTAILNRLFSHVKRTADMLFAPDDIRFNMDFEHHYDKAMLDRAEVAARTVTRTWQRRDIDLEFSEAIFISLLYGICIPKLLDTDAGVECRLVMPWNFGVYRDDVVGYANQEGVCETTYITPFDFWRRISHLPNAVELFRRARAYSKRETGSEGNEGYFHSLLIAGSPPVVQTNPPFSTQPGGLAQIRTASMGGVMMSPQVAQEMIPFHELYVVDDDRGDWTTIQMAEPDILVAPLYRRRNMFVPGHLPYGVVQPNRMSGSFWGRSEIADLMKLQYLLRDRWGDIKKIMSVQYDGRYAITGSGQSGDSQEIIDQMRESGFVDLGPGGDIKDITPKLPEQWAEEIKFIMSSMDEISGFQPIMSGQGEQGVRAGVHAQTLLRTASPRMRNRSLLIERQCADFATTTFELLKAKRAQAFWTAQGDEFLLDQLPDDFRITVDSHSTSPVYEQDHQQIAAFLAKLQVIDGESLLDLLPVPMRDILKARYRAAQEQKAQQAEAVMQNPELLKVIEGGRRGKKR